MSEIEKDKEKEIEKDKEKDKEDDKEKDKEKDKDKDKENDKESSQSKSDSESSEHTESSVDSEELRAEQYEEIYENKLILKAFNRNIVDFDIQFPKATFDRIIQLYGTETVKPLSFVLFTNPFEAETIRYSSRNINVRTSVQIDSILDFLDNYYVYPASFEGLEELEKIKRAPKLKTKYMKNIASKMGLNFSELINYVSLQITEINIRETIRTVVSIQVYKIIFNRIHLLKAKFPEKESFEFAFFSYGKILKMAGIELNKIIPYLNIFEINNQTRDEVLAIEESPLYDKVVIRLLKESINKDIREKDLDLYLGIESCPRIPKPGDTDLEPFRDEASNLLLKN